MTFIWNYLHPSSVWLNALIVRISRYCFISAFVQNENLSVLGWTVDNDAFSHLVTNVVFFYRNSLICFWMLQLCQQIHILLLTYANHYMLKKCFPPKVWLPKEAAACHFRQVIGEREWNRLRCISAWSRGVQVSWMMVGWSRKWINRSRLCSQWWWSCFGLSWWRKNWIKKQSSQFTGLFTFLFLTVVNCPRQHSPWDHGGTQAPPLC